MDKDVEAERLVAVLRAYLGTHPFAADTLEGILGWWLPEADAMRVRPEVLAEALARLVARGDLGRVDSANGQVLYVNRRAQH